MIWLGIIIGFCLGVMGYDYNIKKKIKKVDSLEELKKIL